MQYCAYSLKSHDLIDHPTWKEKERTQKGRRETEWQKEQQKERQKE